MRTASGIARAIVVILDGLRADAVPLFPLPHLRRLAEAGAYTLAGQTVQPSITPAALGSFLTGMAPRLHGVESDRILASRPRRELTPLPTLLRRHGVPVRAFRETLPPFTRGVAARVTKRLEIEATFAGATSDQVLDAALPSLVRRDPGLSILHWLDADRAGHARGWGSADYAAAARRLDATLGRLLERVAPDRDPATLLIVFADHGGGGRRARDHDSTHPLDTTIPIILAGGQVIPQVLGYGASLLDIPATIAWAFGVHRPPTWGGRPLAEALQLPGRPSAVPPAVAAPRQAA
ncbi:MAG TPA: alkaline phosphatase family protein [Gemmatimonadales bacterium]|nr:alkaline phosphatase family protein [Gemmatimonadales bacterium]